MDKLKAVNTALQALGEYPVNALDTGLPLAGLAQQEVEDRAKQMQHEDWWFNTETKTLVPDDNDEIEVPSDILKVRIPRDKRSLLTVRDGRLYDMRAGSYEFRDALNVEVVLNLPWDMLPLSFRRFVALSAGRHLQKVYLGSQQMDRLFLEEYQRVWEALYAEHLENERFNTNHGTMDMMQTTMRKGPW